MSETWSLGLAIYFALSQSFKFKEAWKLAVRSAAAAPGAMLEQGNE